MYEISVTGIILRLVAVSTAIIATDLTVIADAQIDSDSHLSPSSTLLITNIGQLSVSSPAKAGGSKEKPSIHQDDLIPGTYVNASSFGYNEAQRLAKENVIIGKQSSGKFIDLISGNILLNPEKNIVVGINKIKINIAAKAIVFIIASENEIVVYNLHQSNSKQVVVTVDKHSLVVEPSRMLVVTNQNMSDFKQLDVNRISMSYNNEQSVDLGSDTERAFKADFLLTSALSTIAPLRRIILSSNQVDNAIIQTLTKDIIIQGGDSNNIEGSKLDLSPTRPVN